MEGLIVLIVFIAYIYLDVNYGFWAEDAQCRINKDKKRKEDERD